MLNNHRKQTHVLAKSDPSKKKTKKTRNWELYLSLKSVTHKICQEAYNNYLIKTLTSDQNGNKRLGAIIKSKQHDHLGVAPLNEGNIIYCDPIQKANILNCQFKLSLQMIPRHPSQTLGPRPYPRMDGITESSEGVVKPLKNLKLHKTAGPDDILLMLHKDAAE